MLLTYAISASVSACPKLPTVLSPFSVAYCIQAYMSCLPLFMHITACALNFALERAGNSIAARIAMMAITTRSSIRVKAACTPLLNDRRDFATDWSVSRSLFIPSGDKSYTEASHMATKPSPRSPSCVQGRAGKNLYLNSG